MVEYRMVGVGEWPTNDLSQFGGSEMLYVAYLPKQGGYLVWDEKSKDWRSTSDKRVATIRTSSEWAQVALKLTAKFKLVPAN